MQIDITSESLLKQLKLSVNENSLSQMQITMDKTPHSDKFFKHLFSLNDALSHFNAFIAPSSSNDYLKIKLRDDAIQEHVENFNKEIRHWSDKYKVSLEKVDNKELYYIKGILD